MRQSTILLILGALVADVYTAPQFITFDNGKIGVNFMGYKAAAGLGGSASGSGLGGGLVAEAGTPFGHYVRSGLDGAVAGEGGVGGRLYASADAGGSKHAAAGLSGAVTGEGSAGFGHAEAGGKGVQIEKSGDVAGSSGFSYSGGSSFSVEKNVQPIVKTVEVEQPVYKEVKTEVKTETANEVIPSSVGAHAGIESRFNVDAQPQPAVFVKEVHVEQPPPTVYHKEVVRYKPHRRHHFHKTAYIGGYIGGGGEVAAPPPPPPPQPAVVYETYQPAVYKTYAVQPAIEKRVDVGVNAGAGGYVEANAGGGGGLQHTYTKQVSFQRNPTFFADIFNIPISTLKAVGNFLGNTAASTNVSVQKSASVHTDSDTVASKHLPSSSTSSETHVQVQTAPASSFLDDIFAIPINTLGAVNKFLENNVPVRKNVQISTAADGEAVVTKVRRGPHARRRANKQVVIVEESEKPETEHH